MLIGLTDGYHAKCLRLTWPADNFLFRGLDAYRIHGPRYFVVAYRWFNVVSVIIL